MFNHRSVAEILRTIRILGGMIGCEAKTRRSSRSSQRASMRCARGPRRLPRRPRVYFEEWDEPQISGIRWVSELIGIAGGEDCFPELARESLGKQSHHRGSAGSAAARAGHHSRLVVRQEVSAGDGGGARRAGQDVPAVRSGFLREIKSSLILQPGPAALTDGVRAIQDVILEWARGAQR